MVFVLFSKNLLNFKIHVFKNLYYGEVINMALYHPAVASLNTCYKTKISTKGQGVHE